MRPRLFDLQPLGLSDECVECPGEQEWQIGRLIVIDIVFRIAFAGEPILDPLPQLPVEVLFRSVIVLDLSLGPLRVEPLSSAESHTDPDRRSELVERPQRKVEPHPSVNEIRAVGSKRFKNSWYRDARANRANHGTAVEEMSPSAVDVNRDRDKRNLEILDSDLPDKVSQKTGHRVPGNEAALRPGHIEQF